jgi:hypothetical protein
VLVDFSLNGKVVELHVHSGSGASRNNYLNLRESSGKIYTFEIVGKIRKKQSKEIRSTVLQRLESVLSIIVGKRKELVVHLLV